MQGKHHSYDYRYRDPLHPSRTVLLSETSRWKYPRLGHDGGVVRGFDVWLKSKKPTTHFVKGDLLDALAVAAAIIHAPKGKPYGSEKEKE